MGTILEHLHLLRDVDGVYGSFVLAECGSPIGLDLSFSISACAAASCRSTWRNLLRSLAAIS